MNLYEYEGKALLRAHGIAVPDGAIIRADDDAAAAVGAFMSARPGKRCVIKAQVLAGKRAERGGVVFCESAEDTIIVVSRWLREGLGGLHVTGVLIEDALAFEGEYYVSCSYDGLRGGPVLLFSERGGGGVETGADVQAWPIDPRHAALPDEAGATIAAVSPALRDACTAVIELFFKEDAAQIEINPLVVCAGQAVALDAKIALDDAAAGRHTERPPYPERAATGRAATPRERAARAIDADAYQGTAGTYLELNGSVAVLCSGGGASLVCMDTLAANGLKAANYTEYSGNPPRERVRALADVVLSKPGLRGLLIAGGVANFTDVKETFAGIADALDALKPSYPIVVRRAGPNERAGMEAMQACAIRNGLRMELFGKETPLHEAVAALARMIEAYGHSS